MSVKHGVTRRGAPLSGRRGPRKALAKVRKPAARRATQLLSRERRERAAAEILAAANLALAQSQDLDSILATLLDYLGRLVPSDSSTVLLLDDEGASVSIGALRGYEKWMDPELVRRSTFDPRKNGLLRKILGDRRPLVVPDTAKDARWERVAGGDHIRSWLGVPLVARDKAIGLYSLDRTQPGFFSDEHVRWAESLAPAAATAVEIARLLRDVREAAEFSQQIVASADEGIVVLDREHRCRVWNPSMERLSGIAAEAAIGKTHRELFPHLAAIGTFELERRALLGETVTTPDLPGTTADGRAVWSSARLSPLRNAAGAITGVIGVVRGITKRKRIEALRADQSHILERIAAHAPLEETLASLAGLVESACPRALCTILLLDEDGIHMRHGAAPSMAQAYIEAINGIAIGPAVGSCGTAMFRGQVVVVTDIMSDPLWADYRQLAAAAGLRACWSTPILADDQRVLGSFAVYAREPRGPDAAERVAVNIATHLAGIAIERGQAARRLADSEARYRSLFEGAPDGILVADSEGTYVDVNPSGLEMLGYSRDELIGMPPEGVLAPQEHGRVRAVLAEISQGIEHRHEWQFRRRDGSTFHADVMATGMADGRILALIRDATERKRMEEQLRQSQKMEAVGRLAGGVAHDFNNILGVILGYGDMLRNKTPDNHPDRRRMDQIVHAAERAAGLTRQLLAFSRKQVLEPRVLEPSAVIADMRRLLERLIGEDVEFVLKAEAKGRVKVDPGQLGQVLMNLVVNARDAMPMGGALNIETADVELDGDHVQRHSLAVAPGRYVRIAVADTGQGMDEATQAQAFEPFFTTKPEGQGTGLGLATVYGIVRQSGGYISMDSDVGQGTVFRVYLPRVEDALDKDPKRPSDQSRAVTETVLVVEDEPAARELVGEILRAEGYSVLLAANGQEAVEVAMRTKVPVQLLLTDVVLPKLSGRAAAGFIREIHHGIKVLYMSGYTDDQVSRHGVLEPGILLLAKPFTPAELIRRVGQVLDEP